MSRSSYKGYYLCDKTIRHLYKSKLDSVLSVKVPLFRSSTITNVFREKAVLIEKGRGVISFGVKSGSATFKAGQFIFTRKPYFFPKKKRKLK